MDTVIIGGGPHALAALAALVGADGQCQDVRGAVAVLDPGAQFMQQWHARFAALEIEYLRSPAFVHPVAFQPAALVNFAIREGRTTELVAALPPLSYLPMARTAAAASCSARNSAKAQYGV